MGIELSSKLNLNLDYVRILHCFENQDIYSTLCICTFRRPVELNKLITELLNFVYLPKEIIIVDGSGDSESYNSVREMIISCGRDINFIYIFSPAGLTLQRNVGLDISNGKVIHYIDDDCIPFIDYFQVIDNFFDKNSDYGAVTGNIINEYSFKPGLRHRIRTTLGIYPPNGKPGTYYCNGSSVPKGLVSPPSENIDIDIMSGASMSMRKALLVEVGGFSPFFDGYSQGEDIEISLRIKKYSRIILLAEAKCNHYHTPSSRPNLRKKGQMEVYNRFVIWSMHSPNKNLSCQIKMWLDFLLLCTIALFMFMKSLKKSYFNYFVGYCMGIQKSIFNGSVSEKQRVVFYSLKNN